MAKKKTISYWDKKIVGNGGVLNNYIKYRDAVDLDENGKPICECITCGKRISGRNLHAGHYIRRAIRSTRYDERNLAAQCAGCNNYKSGEPVVFRQRLMDQYGQDTVEELEEMMNHELAGNPRKWKTWELEEVYNDYRRALRFAKNIPIKSLKSKEK